MKSDRDYQSIKMTEMLIVIEVLLLKRKKRSLPLETTAMRDPLNPKQQQQRIKKSNLTY